MTPDVGTQALEALFLNRLRGIVELERVDAAGDDLTRLRLIRAALLSTLADCTALGIGEQAAAILRSHSGA